MIKKQSKPSWWILYVLVVLMIFALIAVSQDGLPNWANEIGDTGIIVMVFAAMALWVKVNMPALLEEEMNEPGLGELRIEEYIPVSASGDKEREISESSSSPNNLN